MSIKAERQKAILEAVAAEPVATQAHLKRLLKARGFEADQATLSRDIRELGLVKVSDDGVHARYAPVEAVAPPVHPRPGAIVSRLVRRVDWSGNLLVLKTDPGEASPVGIALDRLGWPEVVGTVAGDDTLLVVLREGASARRLARKIVDLKTSRKDTA
jgi:transcriptional regulator of arginine metabolism